MADPESLHQLAHELLDGVLDAYTLLSVDPPETQYVTVGEVAIDDCPSLIVSIQALSFGVPGGDEGAFLQQIGKCTAPIYPTFDVWATRCVPVPGEDGSPPPAADLDASALEISKDAMVLVSGMLTLINNRDIFSACQRVAILTSTPYGPSGGYGGWVASYQIDF